MRRSALTLVGGSLVAMAFAGTAAAQVAGGASVPPAGAATDSTPPGDVLTDQTATPESSTPSGTGDVVVTARLRAERLRDVPVSATAIGAQLIADQGGITNMKQLVQNAPGVHFLDTGTPTTSEISIRGSQTSRGTTADTTVGLYRDGVFVPGGYLSGRSLTPMDLFDVQQVEVLRGPQGGLYGRNAVGGAVVVTTNKPGYEPGASAMVSYGRFDRYQGQAIVNLPVDEVLAFRFGVQFTNQDKGYVYNPTRREYTDDDHYLGYKGQARFRFGEKTNFNISADFFRWNAPPLLLVLNYRPGDSALYPNGVTQDRRRVGHNGFDSTIQKANTVISTFDHDLDWAKFTYISSFRYRDNTNDFDSDIFDQALREQVRLGGGNVTALNANTQQTSRGITKRYTQEARLIGDAGPFQWLFGGDYTVLKDVRKTLVDRQVQPAPPVRIAASGNLTTTRSRSESFSIYGSAGYDVLPRVNITAEGRFTKDLKHFINSNRNTVTGALLTTQSIDARSKDQDFAYTLTANYKIADWLLYGRVATAYRPGGFNGDLGLPQAPNPVIAAYSNEDTRSFELGAKGNIIPNVFISGAAYIAITHDALDTQNNGCAVGVPPCNSPPIAFLVNGGKARVYGFEADIKANAEIAGGQARLTLGGSYERGKFLNGPNVGEELARVPHWLFNGNLNYSHPIVGDWAGFGNAEFHSTHGGVQDVVNPPTPLFQLDNFVTADFRAGIGNKQYEIAAYARNAFNADPVVFRAIGIIRYLAPATYGVQFSAKF